MSKRRIKRAMAEAAGWLCLLGLVIVVAAMDSGALRPLAGGGIGLGLELIGALSLYTAGVVRFPDTRDGGREFPHQSPAATASPRGSRERGAVKW